MTILTVGPEVSWPPSPFLSFTSHASNSPHQLPLEASHRAQPATPAATHWATRGPRGEVVLCQVPADLAAQGTRNPPGIRAQGEGLGHCTGQGVLQGVKEENAGFGNARLGDRDQRQEAKTVNINDY